MPVIEKIIQNEPLPAPKVTLDPSIKDFYAFTKNSFTVVNYQAHEFREKIPVAV